MEIMKSVMRVVSTIVMVVAIALAIALVGVRLIGYDVYTVLSGSMEPTYHTGSVIYVRDCEPEDVQVGDPITFVLNEDLVVATHRVIGIDEEKGAFYTQGDANDAPDGSPVLFENLIGKPVFSIPYLGYVADYVQNPPGTYVAVAVCALLVMFTFLPDLFAKDEDEEEPESKKAKGSKRSKKNEGSDMDFQAACATESDAAYARQARRATYAQRPYAASPQRQASVQPQPARSARATNDPRSQRVAQAQRSVRQPARVPAAQQEQQVRQRQTARQGEAAGISPNNPRLKFQAQQQQRAAQAARQAAASDQDWFQYSSDDAWQGARPRGQRRSQ